MQKTKNHYFKISKWIVGILFIPFALLATISWLLNVKSKPILTERIKTLLYTSTDSLYVISFSNVSTNIFTGNATLNNVKIIPDTNRYKELVRLKRAPNNLYQVSLKKLVVRHFHPLILFREQKLNIEEILFDKPEISMTNKQLAFNENRPMRPIKSPYQFISKNLKSFGIDSIRFRDISFQYINKNLANASVFSISKLNITLTDLLVDSTSADDPDRFYLLKDIEIGLKDYSYPTPDKLYRINLNQLNFRASTGELNIKKFAVQPLYNEFQFGKFVGYAKDRFDIRLSNLALNGIDLPLYIRNQELWAKDMDISNGSISVFNNNELPNKQQENKIGKFPHQLLQKIGYPVLIQNINLKDIYISYAVFDKESKERGKISFQHTSGTIKNVTNVEKIKAVNPFMEANLTTYLMGQGKLNVDFKFDLTAKDGAFAYAGTLHEFNARVLNQITVPLGMVRINRGNIDQLQFDFKANDLGTLGSVKFSYFDLSVALMKNDPNKDHLVKRGFMSFLANALIINSENPGPDGKMITANVLYKRPPNTSFFNLIWKSLYLGIKHSIGITEEKQQEMRDRIATFKAIRNSRELRKKKRILRRHQQEQHEE